MSIIKSGWIADTVWRAGIEELNDIAFDFISERLNRALWKARPNPHWTLALRHLRNNSLQAAWEWLAERDFND